MEQERLRQIRRAERESHQAVYESRELYAAGSWLAKPVKTVMELVPIFEDYQNVRVLDLGCGVGRNSIALARALPNCRIDCVDIMDYAIEKLRENAAKYQVEKEICAVVKSIDEYRIREDCYDLILGVSALEHLDSEEAFVRKLEEIRRGLRQGGVFCLIMNSNVTERDAQTGSELPPQFEVNLPAAQLQEYLESAFSEWTVLKYTVGHQRYQIPRGDRMADLETDVLTWVVRKSL